MLMILSHQHPFKIVLGSASPRRKELLLHVVNEFDIRVSETDEIAPTHLSAIETAIHVSLDKAKALWPTLEEGEVLITSDTEVWMNGTRFGKPATADEAKSMLRKLSGKEHQVVSGFCVSDQTNKVTGSAVTKVFFKSLTEDEIEFYVQEHRPFDKAGAYGIQEWIGLIGIEKIEGSYFNVVGLPVFELYESLMNFIDDKKSAL